MKNIFIIIFLTIVASLFAKSKPVPGFTAFLLGEPAKEKAFTNQLPQGESAISCLVQAGNGLVFAGTRVVKGKTPWIVCYDPVKKAVPNGNFWPLSKAVPGEKSVTALVAGSDGLIYGATSDPAEMDYRDQEDFKNAGYGGGHLFYFKPDPKNLAITDMGIPFKGEGIVALAADLKRKVVYGVTSPGLVVFAMAEADKRVEKLGTLGGLEILRNLYIGKAPAALVLDDSGCLYGSAPQGKLFKYNPASKSLTMLPVVLPTEGEGQSYDAVTAFTKTATGRIFGGTFLDGKLFEVFPKSGKIKALGITGRTGHVRGLVEKDGVLYGFSGSTQTGSRFFAFNIATGEYQSFPEFKVYFKDTSIKWIPFQLEAMIPLTDGSFMAGENEDNGHLYLYEPVKLDWIQ
jgi:hypothetical protein